MIFVLRAYLFYRIEWIYKSDFGPTCLFGPIGLSWSIDLILDRWLSTSLVYFFLWYGTLIFLVSKWFLKNQNYLSHSFLFVTVCVSCYVVTSNKVIGQLDALGCSFFRGVGHVACGGGRACRTSPF